MTSVINDAHHFSGTCTRMVLELVEWRLGPGAIAGVLADAAENRAESELRDDTTWSTYPQFRRLLETVARRLGGPDTLRLLADIPCIQPGTRPDITALLQKYGSPAGTFVAATAGLGAAFVVDMEMLGPNKLEARYRLAGDLEPFPELCAFVAGLQPLSVRLCGLRLLDCSEISCRCRGDDECAIRLAWDQTDDLESQLDHAHLRLAVAESRLDSVQRVVEEIVSAPDLDTVLGRIVESAAHSATAAGFVLEIDTGPVGTKIFTSGIDIEQAGHLIDRASAGQTDVLAVEVVSKQRRYGRLIASHPGASIAFIRPSLESYARLAATALDSAYALAEARRQADMTRALLELSTSLAELTTAGELAGRVAQTMPAVIDCDCAVVLLIRDGVYRIAGHHGFDSEEVAALDVLEVSVEENTVDRVIVRTAAEAIGRAGTVLAAMGLQALATAPISVDETAIGVLTVGVRHRPARLVDDPHLAERFGGLAGQAAVALRNGRLLDQIRHQSLHDPLTNLANRALILERAEQMLSGARRRGRSAAVLFIDLDGFKEINDTLGHASGDELLKIVADRLRAALRGNDTVGRLGGDEFVVLVEDASSDGGVEAVADRLLKVLGQPLRLKGHGHPLAVHASIGIAQGHREAAGDLLRDADIALYDAKAAGRGCYRVFVPAMQEQVRARAELTESLSHALPRREFSLVYQPIFDLATCAPTAVEALLRWQHPEKGSVGPDRFVPLLEESDLILEVGEWVLRRACGQAAEWHRSGYPVEISINVSIRQLERSHFVEQVRCALDRSGLAPAGLTVEITETAIMRDTEAISSVLCGLKALGVRVAIDDFGTGYSSLAHLSRFPVDALKIDRSFIAAAEDSRAAGELIRTLVGLGRALRLEIVAEGIEHPDQLDSLRREGCDRGQGYLLARPLPAAEVTDLLRAAGAVRSRPAPGPGPRSAPASASG